MRKYIPADKLIAEIEELKSVYSSKKRVIHGIADGFRQDGMAVMCDIILTKITSLQQEQPSIPSNLDEAAEDSWAVYEYRESPRGLYSTCYVDGFKAGAEWMAVQGLNAEKEEQPRTRKTCRFYENDCPLYPNKVCKDYTEKEVADLAEQLKNKRAALRKAKKGGAK